MNKKKTYKLQLPKDVNVDKAHLRIHDGQIVVDVEFREEIKPKDGNFLVGNGGNIFIYSDKKSCNKLVYSCYCGVTRYTNDVILEFSNNWTNKEGCRFATPEEKSAFLERLEKECHKTWNEEKKCLEDVYVPKFGDIVRVDLRDNDSCDGEYMICVYPNANNFFECNEFFNIVNLSADKRIIYFAGSHVKSIKEASESEKKELFDKLAEVGKKWNPETKKLEDIRWRAEKDCTYYYVDERGNILGCNDTRGCASDSRYLCGNYFKTREAARPYADQIKEIFKNSKYE